MKKLIATFLVVCILLIPDIIFARGGHGGRHSGGFHSSGHKATYTLGVPRDSSGHIKRSSSAKNEFMKQTSYFNGRQGYIVDHVIPLKRGGADVPSNMQWQTKEAARAKDKVE